jgi:hypothetical protein
MALENTGRVFINRFDPNAGCARVGVWESVTVDRKTGFDFQPVLTSFELRFCGWIKDFVSGAAAKRSARQRNSKAWRDANKIKV